MRFIGSKFRKGDTLIAAKRPIKEIAIANFFSPLLFSTTLMAIRFKHPQNL
jgi:hypothetical protein